MIHAVFEQFAYPWDNYLVSRTSTDALSWTTKTIVGADDSAPTNGRQGYRGRFPALIIGSIDVIGAAEVGGGDVQRYGHGSFENPDSC